MLQDCGRIPHCGLSIETRASGRYDLGLVFPDNADFQGALDMGDGGEGQGLAWERGYRSALVIPSAVYLKREARRRKVVPTVSAHLGRCLTDRPGDCPI